MKIEIDWVHLTDPNDIKKHHKQIYGWDGHGLPEHVLFINGIDVGSVIDIDGKYLYPVRHFDDGLTSPIEKRSISKRNKDLDKTKAKLMASIQAEAKWLIKTLTKHQQDTSYFEAMVAALGDEITRMS